MLVGRFEEAVRIIAGLLRNDRVDFAGTYYQARDCELRPRGARPNGLPIMIGTTGDRILRLTAEHADLWNAWGLNTSDDMATTQAKADAACAAVGRDPATLGRTCTVLVDLPGKAGRPRETPPYVTGDAETLAEILRGHSRPGISHV